MMKEAESFKRRFESQLADALRPSLLAQRRNECKGFYKTHGKRKRSILAGTRFDASVHKRREGRGRYPSTAPLEDHLVVHG